MAVGGACDHASRSASGVCGAVKSRGFAGVCDSAIEASIATQAANPLQHAGESESCANVSKAF